MRQGDLRIVAPVSSVDEVLPLLAAGADELYCGAMFDEWVGVFGEADLISRRQGRLSHITSPKELTRIARLASDQQCKISLTLNSRYTGSQMQQVFDLIRLWEDAGGSHVLLSDPALLFALRDRGSALKRHLSIMAGTFNGAAVQFFKEMGVSRIVLPRELCLEEVGALIGEADGMEFEMLAMLQKCRFIDGFCGFYHGIRLPSDQPSHFRYTSASTALQEVATAIDPDYEGHGCQLDYRTANGGRVRHLAISDEHHPPCAACMLPELYAAGIRFLKIAGRGYPLDQLVQAVRFVSESLEIFHENDAPEDCRQAVRELYRRSFGTACRKSDCYYFRIGK